MNKPQYQIGDLVELYTMETIKGIQLNAKGEVIYLIDTGESLALINEKKVRAVPLPKEEA